MKIRRELIDSTIIYDGSKYKVEETKNFIKLAKMLGFDVFEKKAKKVKVEDAGSDNESDSQ